MEEFKLLRGHHLASMYQFYCRNGMMGAYYDRLFAGNVKVVDGNDEDCENCGAGEEIKNDCDRRFRTLDQVIANKFGVEVGKIYPFRLIKHIVEEKAEIYHGVEFWNKGL